jgi:hypothetical protein
MYLFLERIGGALVPNGGRDPVKLSPSGSGALLPISGKKCQFVILFIEFCINI